MFNIFGESKEEKADKEYKESVDQIGLNDDIQSHIIELQSSLDERGQRALACLLETATKNRYSGSCVLGGWMIAFNDGIVTITKPNNQY